jgi:ABC-type multidrug transport system fused ATPase/permease subunit
MLNVINYYKNNKTLVIKLVLMTLTVGILEAAGIFAIIPYVDVMFAQGNNQSLLISQLINLFPSLQNKTYITLFFLGFYILRGIVLATIIFRTQMIVAAAHTTLLNSLFQVSFDADVYSKEQSSKLIRVYTRDSLVFIYSFLVQASILSTELIIFTLLLFGIVYYQPQAILLFPFILIFVGLGYFMIKRKVSAWSKEVQTYDSRMIKNIQESHNAHDEITVYKSFSGFQKRIKNVFSRKTFAYAKTESLMMMPRIMLETILVVLVVLTIFYVTQIYSGVIQPSIAIFIILAGFRFLPMANKITQSLAWFRNGLVALEELNRVYKHPKRDYKLNISENDLNDENDRIAIIAKDVVSNIFENENNNNFISFTVNYGELVCIIGETGSGKSTLLKQIAGVIDIQGQIVFKPFVIGRKGDPILSYVPQAPAIINDTVKSNIIFMRNSLSDSGLLNEILSIVKLNKRILSSDNGIETVLSESGKNLSGGEKYRVCLARALLSKPNVLIMDEPTSSLDKTTSVQVIQNIKKFLPDSAIIISSHDQDIINLSDKVVKL